MAIPLRARLLRELHCLSHNGEVVHTAQWWSDPVAEPGRPRSWVRLVLNGATHPKYVHQHTGVTSHRRLAAAWEDLAGRYAPTGLTEDQMWVKLRELTGMEQGRCVRDDCSAGLPVSWPVCPGCGRDTRRVASGSLSRVRQRPAILMDLRTSPETTS